MHLVTQRLLLRPFTIDDVIDAHEIFSNEEVMRFCEPVYDIIETTKLVELFAHEGDCFCRAGTLVRQGYRSPAVY